MNKEITFSQTATIHASPQSVWEVLLSGRLYEVAWGAKLETTWAQGTSIQFNGVWESVAYSDRGEVLVHERYRMLKYSYWSSFWEVADIPDEYCFISYRLEALDEHTSELTIAQEGFRDEKHYSDTVELLIRTLDIIKYMSEKLELSGACSNAFNRIITLVEAMPEEAYNRPVPDGWSVGQVVEHVIMSSSGLTQLFSDASLSSGPYDTHVPAIKEMMLGSRKLKTVEGLVPPIRAYDRQLHKHLLLSIRDETQDAILSFDLRQRVESFPLPPFGYMSIFEWLTFVVFHVSRHAGQVDRVQA